MYDKKVHNVDSKQREINEAAVKVMLIVKKKVIQACMSKYILKWIKIQSGSSQVKLLETVTDRQRKFENFILQLCCMGNKSLLLSSE